jgi:hypothetical protein
MVKLPKTTLDKNLMNLKALTFEFFYKFKFLILFSMVGQSWVM